MDLTRAGPILCFGEVLLRLNPAFGVPLSDARGLSTHVGGAEANVAATLAQLGHNIEIATVLPSNPLGDLCLGELRRFGIGTEQVLRRDGRLGLYFLEPGAALRPSRIVYDRTGSAFALEADTFDWAALAGGIRWFHVSGITPAVSDAAAKAAKRATEAMREAGVPVSFDTNHRASLWAGREAEGAATIREMADRADLLFASAYDIGRALDLPLAGDTPEARRMAAEAALEAFPHLSIIASTRREIAPDGAQRLGARMDTREAGFETELAPLGAIVDRIGSGDAFAGAIIDGLLRRQAVDGCTRLGLAGAALKHGIAGDRWIGSRAELEGFEPGSGLDVQR